MSVFTPEQWELIEELVALEIEGHVMHISWSEDSNIDKARRTALERNRVKLRAYATQPKREK